MSSREMLRSALSSEPAARALRSINSARFLSDDQRAFLYLRLTKKLASDPTKVFTHRVQRGEPISVHLDGTIRRLYWTGTYETDALPLFATYARESNTILDIGAAEGVYTLFAAAANPNARILACEASPAQQVRLRANLALNDTLLGDRVDVVTAALSDRRGTAEFYEVPGGTSSLNPEFRPGSPSRAVPLIPGDAVVDDLLSGRSVDLIKIDTESTEPDVLRGLETTLARDRPVLFCEVLAGRTEPEMQALMEEFDYRPYWLSGEGPLPRRKIVCEPGNRFPNWLFLPDDRPPLST